MAQMLERFLWPTGRCGWELLSGKWRVAQEGFNTRKVSGATLNTSLANLKMKWMVVSTAWIGDFLGARPPSTI